MALQENSNDKREYTIKIIPHQEESIRSVHLSMKMLKQGAVSLAVGALLFVGAFSYAAYSSYSLQSDESRIEDLQKVNSLQQEQLLQLSRKANTLQDEVDELNQLESELRQLSGIEGSAADEDASGEFAVHDGQGGPMVKPDLQNVNAVLDDVEKRIKARRASLEQLREAIKEQQINGSLGYSGNSAMPSMWPTSGDVSSPYGLRWNGSDFHPGIDIANDYGTPIVATADGIVTVAGWNSGGYGNMVDIDHGNGYATRYAHAEQVVVSPGQSVHKGQVIAYMGSTGYSTGPHVHYEIRVNGQAINPVGYL